MSWAPDVVVDEATARRLIESQFPELGLRTLELLGEGWDMTVWVVNDELVFRFPRREVVVPGLERELAVLPLIAPELPLAIPIPAFAGTSDASYPWPFYGAPLIPGREIGQAGLDQAQRDALALRLGEFLRALHSLDTPDLPQDPMGRADMAVRVPRMREGLAKLAATGAWRSPPLVDQILRDAEQLAPADEQVLAHSDLHLRHLLVDGGGASGVIDWIDVCLAPRSVDLALYWALFSEAGRHDFEAAYAEAGPDDLLRARVLALNLCGVLAQYAHTEGIAWLEAEAVAGLDRTVG